eukprot:6270624-Amphidinium_carterae.1
MRKYRQGASSKISHHVQFRMQSTTVRVGGQKDSLMGSMVEVGLVLDNPAVVVDNSIELCRNVR